MSLIFKRNSPYKSDFLSSQDPPCSSLRPLVGPGPPDENHCCGSCTVRFCFSVVGLVWLQRPCFFDVPFFVISTTPPMKLSLFQWSSRRPPVSSTISKQPRGAMWAVYHTCFTILWNLIWQYSLESTTGISLFTSAKHICPPRPHDRTKHV